jgi:mono/diheme cytochrome c family protein
MTSRLAIATRNLRSLLIIAMLAAVVEGAAAQDSPAAAIEKPDPQVVEKGKRTYRDFCQKCHGLNLVSSGGGFFDLRTFPPDQKPRFVTSVTNGKRAMPAWGGVLKQEEIEWLWAYIVAGNAPR